MKKSRVTLSEVWNSWQRHKGFNSLAGAGSEAGYDVNMIEVLYAAYECSRTNAVAVYEQTTSSLLIVHGRRLEVCELYQHFRPF